MYLPVDVAQSFAVFGRGVLAVITNASSNTVSWQSAFWAIVAAVINILVQNAGAPAGLRLEWDHFIVRVALRTSPIVCAADTLLIVFEMAYLTVRGISPRLALESVWFSRFSSEDVAKRERRREEASADKMWIVNVIASIVAAIQLVKVFGMQGIPLTQALAGTYLLAFLILEALRLTSNHVESESEVTTIRNTVDGKLRALEIRAVKRCKEHALIAAAVCQGLVWIWTLSRLFPVRWLYFDAQALEEAAEITFLETSNPEHLSILGIFLHYCILFNTTGLSMSSSIAVYTAVRDANFWRGGMAGEVCSSIYKLDLWRTLMSKLKELDEPMPGGFNDVLILATRIPIFFSVVVATICLACAVGWFPILYWYILIKFGFVAFTNFTMLMLALICLACATEAAFLAFKLVQKIQSICSCTPLWNSGSSKHLFWSFIYVSFNLFTLFLYYSEIYDPTNTYKPNWADKLE